MLLGWGGTSHNFFLCSNIFFPFDDGLIDEGVNVICTDRSQIDMETITGKRKKDNLNGPLFSFLVKAVTPYLWLLRNRMEPNSTEFRGCVNCGICRMQKATTRKCHSIEYRLHSAIYIFVTFDKIQLHSLPPNTESP